MKLSFQFIWIVIFILASCLKENNPAGNSVQGIGFSSDTVSYFRLEISQGSQSVNSGDVIRLNGSNVPSSDLFLKLSTDKTATAIAEYNARNGTDVKILPVVNYTVPANIVCPAGQHEIQVPLTIINSAVLNYNDRYAIAITVDSVGDGYIIPPNRSTHIYIFSLLNEYDGKYQLKGEFNHPSFHEWFSTNQIEMHTTGPDRVTMYSAIPNLNGYIHPFTLNGVYTNFCMEHTYYVNTANNSVFVQNTHASCDAIFQMSNGYSNRWDPGTKTIFVQYGYNLGPGGIFIQDTSRLFTDTLIWLGPR